MVKLLHRLFCQIDQTRPVSSLATNLLTSSTRPPELAELAHATQTSSVRLVPTPRESEAKRNETEQSGGGEALRFRRGWGCRTAPAAPSPPPPASTRTACPSRRPTFYFSEAKIDLDERDRSMRYAIRSPPRERRGFVWERGWGRLGWGLIYRRSVRPTG